jgi:hypothetical protein
LYWRPLRRAERGLLAFLWKAILRLQRILRWRRSALTAARAFVNNFEFGGPIGSV